MDYLWSLVYYYSMKNIIIFILIVGLLGGLILWFIFLSYNENQVFIGSIMTRFSKQTSDNNTDISTTTPPVASPASSASTSTFSGEGDDAKDSDGDGLTDKEELKLGTDPYLADTDGDGYNDKLEVDTGHDPLNPPPK